MTTNFATTYYWAMDFCRALRERPLWARLLFRFVVGRYAYREFIGMQDALIEERDSPFAGYWCETAAYQADKTPAQWWIERPARDH